MPIPLDPYNVTNQWTRDASNRRRYFTAGAIMPLPVGKGHRFLAQTGPVVNRLIGDWTLQAITTFASGQYYSPLFTGPDPANASLGFVTQLPDCVGDPNSGARTLSTWFNPSAFAIPPATAGRYGTCGMNYAGRLPHTRGARQPGQAIRVHRAGQAGVYGADFQCDEHAAFYDSQQQYFDAESGHFPGFFPGGEFHSGEVGESSDRFEAATGLVETRKPEKKSPSCARIDRLSLPHHGQRGINETGPLQDSGGPTDKIFGCDRGRKYGGSCGRRTE